jgi:hypothetical protein
MQTSQHPYVPGSADGERCEAFVDAKVMGFRVSNNRKQTDLLPKTKTKITESIFHATEKLL